MILRRISRPSRLSRGSPARRSRRNSSSSLSPVVTVSFSHLGAMLRSGLRSRQEDPKSSRAVPVGPLGCCGFDSRRQAHCVPRSVRLAPLASRYAVEGSPQRVSDGCEGSHWFGSSAQREVLVTAKNPTAGLGPTPELPGAPRPCGVFARGARCLDYSKDRCGSSTMVVFGRGHRVMRNPRALRSSSSAYVQELCCSAHHLLGVWAPVLAGHTVVTKQPCPRADRIG